MQDYKELIIRSKADRKELGEALDNLREEVDQLRIYVKYLVFDLEATRRENNYLRKLLSEEIDGELGGEENG